MVLAAVVDISVRKRLEERLHQVVESSPNAIVMIAPTGFIDMVNAQAERMFGYSRNELLGQPIEMLVPERYRRNHPDLRASFFERPISRPMGAGRDLYGLRKDGSEFPVEIGLIRLRPPKAQWCSQRSSTFPNANQRTNVFGPP